MARSDSRKTSLFPANTAIPAGSSFSFINSGINYQITDSNFISALGVTGTIVQDGAATGTAILDTQGTVNNIRNLENGSGIITAVSPENGATISHNIIAGAGDAPLFIDTTLAQPTIRALDAGPGIVLGAVGDVIQISTSATPAASNTIVINQESDFPTQDATTITLNADTIFTIGSSFSTAKQFIVGHQSKITGNNVLSPVLTYTGTSPMFLSVDASLTIKELQIDHPNSEGFNFTDTVGGVILFLNEKVRTISGTKYGTFNNLQTVLVEGSSALDIDDGITNVGSSVLVFSIAKFFLGSTSATFKGIDLGTSVSQVVEIANLICIGPSGSIGITGAAASANIPSGEVATVTSSNLNSIDVPLDTIDEEDIRWSFFSNSGIPDTITDGLLSMQGNAVATTIVTQSVPVLAAGTWVIEDVGQMTGTTAGRLTLDLERNARLPITASVTLEPVSGGTQTMGACIAVNGTVVGSSLRTAAAAPGGPVSISVPWQQTLSPTDYVEVFVSNETGTTNVLCSSAIHRIN